MPKHDAESIRSVLLSMKRHMETMEVWGVKEVPRRRRTEEPSASEAEPRSPAMESASSAHAAQRAAASRPVVHRASDEPAPPKQSGPTGRPTSSGERGRREEVLARLDEEIRECTRCPLYRTATRHVPGEGDALARLVFVGEAPGRDEDLQGRPFVGAAGKLLNKMIEAIGMKREEVYICNMLKHRPPNNRTPEPDEVSACWTYLERQLALLRPAVICTLGAVATKALLGSPHLALSSVRGTVCKYQDISLIPTFHPAYLLRNPAAKKDAWTDLKLVKRLLARAS